VSTSIEPLNAARIDELCALARLIWRAHYPAIIGMEQTEYMLAQRYDAPVIAEELKRDDVWWDTLRDEGTMVAFASSWHLRAERAMKLDKLYVHPERQRRGYGAMLIERVADRAMRSGCDKLALAVNKRNEGAVAAYRRMGFNIAHAVVKEIGGGFVMDDYIMEKNLAPPVFATSERHMQSDRSGPTAAGVGEQ
jgi:diamine N-acetyltransferase